jgi:hypothetical protein
LVEQDEPVAVDQGVTEQESSDDDAETSQEKGDLVTDQLVTDQEEDEFSTTFSLSMPSLDTAAATPPEEKVEEPPSSLDVPPEIESDTLDEPIDGSLHTPSFLEDVEDAIDDADLRDADETIENNEGEPPVELTESDEQDDLDESEVR